MEDRKIRVAITHGDTNGVGYEVIFKTFAAPEMLELCTPIIYGSPKVAAYHHNALGIDANFTIIHSAQEAKDGKLNLLAVNDDDVKVELGQPTPESGAAGVKAMERAVSEAKDQLFDALVCLPLSKENAQLDGYAFPGFHSYVEQCMGDGKKVMPVYVNERTRVALATEDVPLKDVAQYITSSLIVDKCMELNQTLHADFRISAPRIAILALDPADEQMQQAAEKNIIPEAVQKLEEKQVLAFGPYQSEQIFGSTDYMHFDAILALYNDQGKAPMKALCPDYTVDFLGGMPMVITSPDVTPQFHIAGKNQADETPLTQAVYLALDATRNRRNYNEPYANPLQKLYHEHRDESDKTRFNVPKKDAANKKAAPADKKAAPADKNVQAQQGK